MNVTFRAVLMKSTALGAWEETLLHAEVRKFVEHGRPMTTIVEAIEDGAGRFVDVVAMDVPLGVRRASDMNEQARAVAYRGHDMDKAVQAMTQAKGQEQGRVSISAYRSGLNG